MYRLVRVLSFLIFLISLESFALGLGSIESHSALNQPLDAEIEISGLGDIDISEVTVELASREAFEKVGLDRPFYLTALKFSLEQKDDGANVIHVTSREAVKEPFVDFLLEVNWPGGHILREYTILLDPPLFLDEGRAVIETPVAGAVQPSAAPVSASTDKTQAQPVQESGGSPSVVRHDGELSYGNVTRSDTLWSIAKQMRPDDSVTVQQVMMALLRNNPDAFYNNNVNYLKAGYVLRIPDIGQIAEISAVEAEREIRRQNDEWFDAKGQRASQAAPRALGAEEAAAAAGAPGSSASSGPRLKLVAPDASGEGAALEGVSDGTAQGAAPQASVDALRGELALALENSEISRQENMELKARLMALEEQIASMQRLLTLRGDTLAALQSDAAGAAAAAATAAAQEGESGSAAAVEDNTAEAAAGETPQAAAPDLKPADKQAVAPVVAPAAAPEAAAPDLIATILDDPTLLGVAVTIVIVLLIMAWIFIRRRRDAAEMDFEEYMEEVHENEAPVTEGRKREDNSQVAAAAAMTGAGVAAAMEAGAGDGMETTGSADSGLDIFQADDDEIDTLAEADVYLAYRRFDKAEELLKSAIEQSPQRQDYILKLLEVYAADENLDAFVEQAESLYASLGSEGGETWGKVVEMGRQLASDHPLFGGDGEVTDDEAQSEHEAAGGEDAGTLDFDLADDLSSFDAESGEVRPETPEADSRVDNPENADLDEAFSLLGESDPGNDISISDSESDERTRQVAEMPQTDEIADDLDLELDLDNEVGTSAEAQISTREETGESSPFAQLDDEPGDLTMEAHKNGLDEFEAALEADAENLGQDDGAGEAGRETAESGLEDAARELRFASEELTFDLGAEETGQPGDTQDKKNETAIPDALEADIDWLASAVNEEDLNVDFEDEPELISGEDEISTKLDLARAYIDMGDQESARGILDEVLAEGSNDQKGEAEELIRLIA